MTNKFVKQTSDKLDILEQGILTEGEGSIRLTSFYYLAQINYFWNCYLNEEVKRTEPSPPVCVPWLELTVT